MTQYKLSDLEYPKKLDWTLIFDDLVMHGISPYQVAILIGQGWSSVQRWREGTEPKYSIGVSILRVHSKYCGDALTDKRLAEIQHEV